MQTNPQRHANFFTFIKRILKGKLLFSCSLAILLLKSLSHKGLLNIFKILWLFFTFIFCFYFSFLFFVDAKVLWITCLIEFLVVFCHFPYLALDVKDRDVDQVCISFKVKTRFTLLFNKRFPICKCLQLQTI